MQIMLGRSAARTTGVYSCASNMGLKVNLIAEMTEVFKQQKLFVFIWA